jgi:hypothetical protein
MTNGFITKIDYSNNRQVKQRVLTNTSLSGSTILGTTFSDLPYGPNPNLSGVSETITNILGTFSGNTGTTIFIFNDNRLNLGSSSLSAITPTTSGISQTTGNIFTASTNTIIDDNVVNLEYTGVSYTFNVSGMTNIGGSNYSGTSICTNVKILSASTLDYTGRTIWCSIPGILNVDNKIETKKISITNDFTPSGTTDTNGTIGSIVWDDDYLYVKTNNGWGRTTLSGF